MVVALTWCLVACGPRQSLKDQMAATLDMSRQAHYHACIEYVIDIETGLPEVSDWPHLMSKARCEAWEAQLIAAEPLFEDEFAKARVIQVFWQERLAPVVLPWMEDGLISIVQVGLAIISANLLGGALQSVQQPP